MNRNRPVRFGELGPAWFDTKSLDFRFILGPWLREGILHALPARPLRLAAPHLKTSRHATSASKTKKNKDPLSALDVFMIGPDLLKELAAEKMAKKLTSALRVVQTRDGLIAVHPSAADPACLTFTALFECGSDFKAFQALSEHAWWETMATKKVVCADELILSLSDYACYLFSNERFLGSIESEKLLVDGSIFGGKPLLVDEGGQVIWGQEMISLKEPIRGVSQPQRNPSAEIIALWSDYHFYILNAGVSVPIWQSNSPIRKVELIPRTGWAIVSTDEAPFVLLDLRKSQEQVWIKLSAEFFLDQPVRVEKIVSYDDHHLALLSNERRAFLVKIQLSSSVPNLPCLPYPLDLQSTDLIGLDMIIHDGSLLVFTLFAEGQCWYQQISPHQLKVDPPTYCSEEVQDTIDPPKPRLHLNLGKLPFSEPSPLQITASKQNPPDLPRLSHAIKLLANRWPI